MGKLTRKGTHNGLAGFWVKEINGTESFISWQDDCYEGIVKLNYIEDLEEAGRLIELPCAVGDMVWMVIDNRDFKRRMKDYCPSAEELPDLNIVEHNFSLLLLSSIGKTVFLTKEEAEAKLKELENE